MATIFWMGIAINSCESDQTAEYLHPTLWSIFIELGDKRTLFGLFRHVYRGFTVGNGVFLATR